MVLKITYFLFLIFLSSCSAMAESQTRKGYYLIETNKYLTKNKEIKILLEDPIPVKNYNDRLCFTIGKSKNLNTEKVN